MLWLVVVSAATAGEFAECVEAADAGDDTRVFGCGGVVVGGHCAGVGGLVVGHVCLDIAGHVVDAERASARWVDADRGR